MGDHQSDTKLPNTLWAGVRGKCPVCGKGDLFSGFLDVQEKCSECGTCFDAADSGDGPAVFIMLFVGSVVVGGALALEVLKQPPYWVHIVIWGPLAILLPLILLRPLKGWWIVNQYHRKAGEGRVSEKADTKPGE